MYPLPDNLGIPKRQDILDTTYCDICKRKAQEGTKLQWFASSSVMCFDQKCVNEMMDRWQLHCTKIEEEYKQREEERYNYDNY